jgi:hypothetical protein
LSPYLFAVTPISNSRFAKYGSSRSPDTVDADRAIRFIPIA